MLRYQIRPSFYDLDWMGIVSNLSYVRWLEDVRTRLLDMSPYPMSRLMAENLAPALFTTHLDYLNPYVGRAGGLIEVRVTAGEKMGRSRWELVYNFHHAITDLHLVHAVQIGCFVQLPEVRPTRTPKAMIEFLETRLSANTNFEMPYP